MIYDDRFGLVDRGTRGMRGGAVVCDLRTELEVLGTWSDRAWMPLDEREELEAVARLRSGDSDQLFYARQQRAEWLINADAAEQFAQEERQSILERMRWQKLSGIRNDVLWPLEAKLAALAPWRAVIEEGQAKRDAREEMET